MKNIVLAFYYFVFGKQTQAWLLPFLPGASIPAPVRKTKRGAHRTYLVINLFPRGKPQRPVFPPIPLCQLWEPTAALSSQGPESGILLGVKSSNNLTFR